MSRATKVFLCAVVNESNAQNINCNLLIKYKTNELLEYSALCNHKLTMPSSNFKAIKCNPGNTISLALAYLRGVWRADIVYAPRNELWAWLMILCKALRKKVVKTVEVVINNNKPLPSRLRYSYADKLYPMTSFLREEYSNLLELDFEKENLLVPNEPVVVESAANKKGKLENILMAGFDLDRKGLRDYMLLAKWNPSITFHLVGGKVEKEVRKKVWGTGNLQYHGKLEHENYKKLLNIIQVDLFCLPSRIEGFPKVVVEMASIKVPSMLYNDYGADEFIEDGVTGFVCRDVHQMDGVLKLLQSDFQRLERVYQNLGRLAYLWDTEALARKYEAVFTEV